MTSTSSDELRSLHAELERLRGLLRQAGLEPDAPPSPSLTDGRYRQILESAVDFAVIALDLQGLVTHWNEGARRILGWSLEELRGKHAELIFTPEDRANGIPEREMRTALEQGRARDERWHLRRDDSRFWASGEMMPLKDDTGTPVGFVKILRDRTAQRRLEEERERFHLLLEQTPDFVGIADAQGQGLFINRAGRRMVGLEDDGVMRMSIPDFFPPEERDLIRDVSLPAQRAEGQWRAELHFQHLRTGEIFPVDYNAFTLRDAAGRLMGYATVTRDISERKRAEQRVRDSEQDLRLITDQAPEMIGYLDRELRYRWVNQTYLEWFQRPRERIVGLTVLELVGPAAYAIREPYFRRALAGERVGFETFLDVEGKRRDIDLRLIPRLDTEGRVQGVFTFILDVSERKRTERGLREANELLEQRVEERTRERDRIWKNSDELLCVAGFDGHLRSCNPAFQRLVGLDEQTLLATPFLEITHPDDHPAVFEALGKLGKGERLIRFEDRVRRVDGTYRTVSWTAVPDDGFFFVIGRDITLQLQQAQALREVEERLRQSQKMEAVGQLTGGIAHDFNNLLGGIMGSMEMLRRRIDTGRYAETGKYIDATMSSANRAAALTSRLLAFGRRQSLDVKSTDTNALVRSMEELLRRTLGEHVSLRVLLEPTVWPAHTDAHQFENALLNLAINARDAMPDGGLLTVETANTRLDAHYTRGFEELKPGEYVTLSVSDTGQGMTAEVMARAFEPFFTTKPIGQGTGLGLSMIYGFARQVGGHVRIYSEVGRGTSVKLFMPRYLGAEARGAQAAPAGQAPRAQQGETVLVVEDEPAVRLLVTEILEDLGYTAIEAHDARSALPTLDGQDRIDLLVTDVGLPGGTNGRQLAEMARQRRPGLKILFITGYAEGASVRSGFLEPGMEMLTKPFALDVLASRIREMIERK